MKQKQPTHYLFIFLLLLVIFLMPLIIAMALYNKNPLWLHHKMVNKGTLISANLNLQQINLISHNTTIHSLKGRWFLFYLTQSPCQQLCQKNLHALHQIVLALGKNSSRVKYGVIFANNKSLISSLVFNKDPNLLVYMTSKIELEKYFMSTKMSKNFDAYYLADPFGKIILYYPSNAPGEDIYQDLSRLLTISTTG